MSGITSAWQAPNPLGTKVRGQLGGTLTLFRRFVYGGGGRGYQVLFRSPSGWRGYGEKQLDRGEWCKEPRVGKRPQRIFS